MPSRSAAWSQLPPLPVSLGVAGPFAGVTDGALLVAGGANFPDKMPWEGGRKVWHADVFALEKPDGKWRKVGQLPCPLGYGVALTTERGVLCLGGSDAARHHAEVFAVTLTNGVLQTHPLPSLPVPLANAAGALLGDTVLLCGGSEQPGEQSALNRLFALDLAQAAPQWREWPPCPGKPRILAVAAAVDGAFYLAGGAALEPTNGKVARVYLRDAWRYRPNHGWSRLADLPEPCVAAASPAPVADSAFFLIGGDDGSRVGFQPIGKHPGFAKSIFAYDTKTDSWRNAGENPAPRATLPTVWWRGGCVLPSGEIRPGVRSPEVWSWRLHPGGIQELSPGLRSASDEYPGTPGF
ncbi:MAG: galactose oxidase [Verrucomicrobia bacterium]|nr:galactose oxidase [Verrucomicrobiota bacterium]